MNPSSGKYMYNNNNNKLRGYYNCPNDNQFVLGHRRDPIGRSIQWSNWIEYSKLPLAKSI